MHPLKLRDKCDYSETSKNGWIGLTASISEETKTAQKISSGNSTLGKSKLTFLVYGKDSE